MERNVHLTRINGKKTMMSSLRASFDIDVFRDRMQPIVLKVRSVNPDSE